MINDLFGDWLDSGGAGGRGSPYPRGEACRPSRPPRRSRRRLGWKAKAGRRPGLGKGLVNASSTDSIEPAEIASRQRAHRPAKPEVRAANEAVVLGRRPRAPGPRDATGGGAFLWDRELEEP